MSDEEAQTERLAHFTETGTASEKFANFQSRGFDMWQFRKPSMQEIQKQKWEAVITNTCAGETVYYGSVAAFTCTSERLISKVVRLFFVTKDQMCCFSLHAKAAKNKGNESDEQWCMINVKHVRIYHEKHPICSKCYRV